MMDIINLQISDPKFNAWLMLDLNVTVERDLYNPNCILSSWPYQGRAVKHVTRSKFECTQKLGLMESSRSSRTHSAMLKANISSSLPEDLISPS